MTGDDAPPGVPASLFEPEGGSIRILTMVSDAGNRRLLNEWIAGHAHFERVADEDDVSTADFDCLICDRPSLRGHERSLLHRKEREQVFMPYVLLVESADERGVRTELRQSKPKLWGAIDAVVAMPVAEHVLDDRVVTLLRLREQSREVIAQREQMEILNRVLRHDIRNDLNVMLGWADVIADHVDETGTEYLERITRAGRHIVELTEIAKDVAADIQAGEAADLEPVALEPLLREEVQKRQDAFERADIELRVPPNPDVWVWANPMLSSVFRNLINNAVFHNDSPTPRVDIVTAERQDSVVVRVSDNGPGLSDDQKAHIFEEARKGLDSPGMGMGLFLVSSLVESYRGDVWIEDNDPRGSTFAVELRRVQDDRLPSRDDA